MFEENFPTCTVCERILTSDADTPKNKTKYCILCGMRTDGTDEFCCYKCEAICKAFIEKKKEVKKWKK